MKGTEKQIAWAKEIIDHALDTCRRNIELDTKRLEEYGHQVYQTSIDAMKVMMKVIEKIGSTTEDAEKIINKKDILSGENILKTVDRWAEQIRVGKLTVEQLAKDNGVELDAEEVEKEIYMMHREPLTNRGEIDEGKPAFDKAQAIREAEMYWAHLTDREKKIYHVYVGIHKVAVPADDERSAEQIYHDMLEDDTWPADHDVIELEKIYQVEFKAGPGKHFDGDVNYMMADIGDVHLYAECEWKEGQEEDAGYCTLVQTIVADARRMGFPVESLSFYYDGFEDKLSDDARTACKVWSDSYKE